MKKHVFIKNLIICVYEYIPTFMTKEHQLLWDKIKNFELDNPEASFTFTDRLARENGWTIGFSVMAIEEYKKFMTLLCIAPHPLTPSDEIDQVWHLHLLYTESYWIDFCQNTLGRQIHHGPTKGGVQESDKFTDWYEKTKQLYASVFGSTPPAALWPSSQVRFSGAKFQRVDLKQNWILKKPSFFNK